jgi:hypothetical protein
MSSIHDIPDFPAFDMRSGTATTPYRGFGEVIPDSTELERLLQAHAAQVRSELRDTFHVRLENSTAIPKELDGLIERMWETGWDPRVGDLGLFSATFGSLLIQVTQGLLGGRLIFRSPGDVVDVHNSIFWPGVEVFPFHKVFKCLTNRDGESMAYFVRGVGLELDKKGLLPHEAKKRLPKSD